MVSAWLMISGLVPVSIVCRTVPAGSLMARMKSVEPDGMPLTVARMLCPAVPVNGIAGDRLRGRDLARGVEQQRAEVTGGVDADAVGAVHDRLRLALVAGRQVRQVDRGDQVRELGGERVELGAVLRRVLVAVEEALLVAGDVRRQRPCRPLGDRGSCPRRRSWRPRGPSVWDDRDRGLRRP